MGPFRGPYRGSPFWEETLMGPFRGPYRGSPLWEEMLMGPFRGGTHNLFKLFFISILFKILNGMIWVRWECEILILALFNFNFNIYLFLIFFIFYYIKFNIS